MSSSHRYSHHLQETNQIKTKNQSNTEWSVQGPQQLRKAPEISLSTYHLPCTMYLPTHKFHNAKSYHHAILWRRKPETMIDYLLRALWNRESNLATVEGSSREFKSNHPKLLKYLLCCNPKGFGVYDPMIIVLYIKFISANNHLSALSLLPILCDHPTFNSSYGSPTGFPFLMPFPVSSKTKQNPFKVRACRAGQGWKAFRMPSGEEQNFRTRSSSQDLLFLSWCF